MNLNRSILFRTMTRTSAMAGLAAAVAGSGCASSAEPARSPATAAAATARVDCAGYGDEGPIANILDGSAVERVEPLYGSLEGKTSHARLEGVAIDVRPEPGMTAEWLTRALECHAARLTLSTEQGRTVGRDPLASASGAQIVVRPAGDAFRVELTVASRAQADSILALYARPGR
jgi:hypothetical protein